MHYYREGEREIPDRVLVMLIRGIKCLVILILVMCGKRSLPSLRMVLVLLVVLGILYNRPSLLNSVRG